MEVGDGDSQQVFGLSGFGIEGGEFACREIADGGGEVPDAHHERGKAFGGETTDETESDGGER